MIVRWKRRFYYMTNTGFNGLDFEVLHSNGDMLVECDDYVPLCLSLYYDNIQRYDYLKKKGSYAKIREIEESKRQEFVMSDDKIEWDINDILSFVDKHNEYDNILL